MGVRYKGVKVAPGVRYTPTNKDINGLGAVLIAPFKMVVWIYKMMFVGAYRLIKFLLNKRKEK